ncbi:uncharacterized protein [Choristoneura fumiferana]|uniref:uncharacterized protein n=1 Tax=Choristoneura fumiferana TaxID=7141 RepID=UPI003D155515
MNFIVLLSCLAVLINSIDSSAGDSTLAGDHLLDVILYQVVKVTKGENRQGSEGKPSYALDPIEFEYQHVDLCGSLMCLSANITKGSIYGLLGFEAIKTDFITEGSRVIIDVDINFPTLMLNSDYYEMKGNIMGALPLAGQGRLHIEVKEFRFWTKIILEVCQDGTSIEDFENSGFSIKNIYCRTEFDGNIDVIFNKMVEELLTDYLNRFNKVIASFSADIIKEILNPIL